MTSSATGPHLASFSHWAITSSAPCPDPSPRLRPLLQHRLAQPRLDGVEPIGCGLALRLAGGRRVHPLSLEDRGHVAVSPFLREPVAPRPAELDSPRYLLGVEPQVSRLGERCLHRHRPGSRPSPRAAAPRRFHRGLPPAGKLLPVRPSTSASARRPASGVASSALISAAARSKRGPVLGRQRRRLLVEHVPSTLGHIRSRRRSCGPRPAEIVPAARAAISASQGCPSRTDSDMARTARASAAWSCRSITSANSLCSAANRTCAARVSDARTKSGSTSRRGLRLAWAA